MDTVQLLTTAKKRFCKVALHNCGPIEARATVDPRFASWNPLGSGGRSAITDSTGQYRIESLQAGTYTVTFTRSGFSTLKRDAVELSGSGVVKIDVDMKVGGVAETITVTGETPVVDVQSTRRDVTLDNQTMQNLPSVRKLQLFAQGRSRSADEQQQRQHGSGLRNLPGPRRSRR